MLKEKLFYRNMNSTFSYVEGRLENFHKSDTSTTSFRVYDGKYVGIFFKSGLIEDEEGYKRAVKNLERKREYPFEIESGERHRDKCQQRLTDARLKEISEECMEYLKCNYPQFIFGASFSQSEALVTQTNDKGMNYSNRDCAINVEVSFKHKDSKDLTDGGFGFGLRTFDKKVFIRMADDYLANYEKELPLPAEFILDNKYYGWTEMLVSQLSAENLALGKSILSGRIGQKVFSEDFSLLHDVSDEECWFNKFWDGDGVVTPGDKRILIDHGVILTGCSDKRSAKKYSVPHTGNAYSNVEDVPGIGEINARIARSNKTVKELLNGRRAFVPLKCDAATNEKGEVTLSVYSSLLTDGEKVLGRLPAFTVKNQLFDMLGKDYIGVGCDDPIFNDKQVLFELYRCENV